MADSDLFQKGLKKRRQVLGEKYVDANLAGSDDFMMTFQRAVTELAWGYAWSRSGLDQKTRSLLTLGILGGSAAFKSLASTQRPRLPAVQQSMKSKRRWFRLPSTAARPRAAKHSWLRTML